MFSKLGAISLGKIYGKVRNIGYKLGLVEFKIEDVNLSKISEIKIPGYEHPHQHEELKKTYLREILPRIEDAKKTAHDIQSKL
jgi:pyruvoyl-dependent arginine decarboxylase (PvlArgDC)